MFFLDCFPAQPTLAGINPRARPCFYVEAGFVFCGWKILGEREASNFNSRHLSAHNLHLHPVLAYYPVRVYTIDAFHKGTPHRI